MDSFFARNRLSAYLDRDLPRDEASQVAEAIARDTSLSAEFDAMRHLLELLQDDGPCTPPVGFHARVMSTIETLPPSGSQVARVRGWLDRLPAESLALMICAVVVGIAMSQRDTIPDPLAKPPPVQVTVETNASDTPTRSTVTKESTEPAVPTEPKPADSTPTPTPAPPETPAAGKKSQPQPPVPKSLPYDPSMPLVYRILHGGDRVLYDIAALAEDTGGRLVDQNGVQITPHSLSEARSFSRFFLVTSTSKAASAHATLLQRSGLEPAPIEGPMPAVDATEALFLIEAQL